MQIPKALIATTGDEFELAVKSAFEVLGFQMVPGPHPRADFLGWNGELIVEAKGVNGSAAEKHLRQCQQWCAEVNEALDPANTSRESETDIAGYVERLAELGVRADEAPNLDQRKGILVEGTFRSTPLADRTDPSYPDSLVRVIGRSEICGLTGLQLLGLTQEVMNDAGQKDAVVSRIVETNGVLEGSEELRDFLTLDEGEVPSEADGPTE